MVTTPETMSAAVITRLGGPEAIHHARVPVPRRGPGEVLVRVWATTVNLVDTFVRSGAYRTPTPFPFVVGRDLVGEVVGAPPDSSLAVGSPVWCNSLGHAGRQGAAAEYALVPAERLYPVPDGVDPVSLVALAHPATTAQLALFTHALLKPAETVLVGGGAGHVGRAAIQLAAGAGARVVATASADGLQACLDAGAEVALDHRDPLLTRRLREALPDGVDVHLDTSGHHDLDRDVGLLAPRGRMVLMAGLSRRPALPVGELYTRDASILGFAISNATVDELARAAERVAQGLAAGVLTPGPVDERPLREAGAAHADLEAHRVRGATDRAAALSVGPGLVAMGTAGKRLGTDSGPGG